MCCLPTSLLNLCTCGCSEEEHTSEYGFDHEFDSPLAAPKLILVRGECNGKKYHVEGDLIIATPCDCKKFSPAFEPMCRFPNGQE